MEVDRCLELVPAAIATHAPETERRQKTSWQKVIFTWSLKIDLGDGMKMAFSQSDQVWSHTWLTHDLAANFAPGSTQF